jgi:hypothetical protein
MLHSALTDANKMAQAPGAIAGWVPAQSKDMTATVNGLAVKLSCSLQRHLQPKSTSYDAGRMRHTYSTQHVAFNNLLQN